MFKRKLQEAQSEFCSLRLIATKYELACHIHGEFDVYAKVDAAYRQEKKKIEKYSVKIAETALS